MLAHQKTSCLDESWRFSDQAPEGFEVVATSKDCPIASIQNAQRKMYGVQFHPEVRHSEYGNDLLKHFALEICGCKGD